MPCFKGLAVSIHTPSGPLPEFSIQKQARHHRISSYIPVPPPKFTAGSVTPEQSSFAISITLLTPGSHVPYSRPTPTSEDPNPAPKLVGGLPGFGGERGRYSAGVSPYVPLTSSPNETLAAYIHFDGRGKEEVATLLRKGVETWVNSRWVSVPESEGGGLAEREFLFREVGLERWLNGLDLKGESKDVAARIERRKKKLEKKRRKMFFKRESDDEDQFNPARRRLSRPVEQKGVLRYGEDKNSPVEDIAADEEDAMSSSDDTSEDEMPEVEATGQIKVSLFRVMASGEIKRGEYSPSFDAHDDEDEGMQEPSNEDVDHTTSFAKPKTLDPKSISTQTVTGIDEPSKPFATFTFFYRGERQLQKMGILKRAVSPELEKFNAGKRKSRQIDLSALPALKADKGTTGFAGYRDRNLTDGVKHKHEDDMDSDADEDRPPQKKGSPKMKAERLNGTTNGDLDDGKDHILSPEELKKRAELADGVKKMQLKRVHSFDPSQGRSMSQMNGQTASSSFDDRANLPAPLPSSPDTPTPILASQTARLSDSDSAPLNSPFKKQRASMSAPNKPELPPQLSSMSFEEPMKDKIDTAAKAPRPLSVPDISFTPPASQPSFMASAAPTSVVETINGPAQPSFPSSATAANDTTTMNGSVLGKIESNDQNAAPTPSAPTPVNDANDSGTEVKQQSAAPAASKTAGGMDEEL